VRQGEAGECGASVRARKAIIFQPPPSRWLGWLGRLAWESPTFLFLCGLWQSKLATVDSSIPVRGPFFESLGREEDVFASQIVSESVFRCTATLFACATSIFVVKSEALAVKTAPFLPNFELHKRLPGRRGHPEEACGTGPNQSPSMGAWLSKQ